MLLSMTGFGRASAQYGDKTITAEIKSLNSKQIDLSLRLSGTYRQREPDIRALISQTLQRGKVDAVIYTQGGDADTGAHINNTAALSYKKQILDTARVLGLPEPQGDDLLRMILRMPELLHNEAPAVADDAEAEAMMQVTQQALDALTEHRRAEGVKLEAFFAERIRRIADMLARVPDYEQERIERIRTRITEALEKVSADVDHVRLEQEMIYYIEKLDVTEEKQRLGQHLRYFIDTMEAAEPGQGKKLGFIAQEMGREINTLGSKSNHAEMQALVVTMKDNLEQIKEQVLNVL